MSAPKQYQETNTQEQPPRNKIQRGKAAAVVEVPSELDSEEFKAAWKDWLQHRREIRKPATAMAQRKALAGLAKMGAARAVAAITHSIGNGWQGIFEPNGESRNGCNGKRNALPNGPGQRHPADANRSSF